MKKENCWGKTAPCTPRWIKLLIEKPYLSLMKFVIPVWEISNMRIICIFWDWYRNATASKFSRHFDVWWTGMWFSGCFSMISLFALNLFEPWKKLSNWQVTKMWIIHIGSRLAVLHFWWRTKSVHLHCSIGDSGSWISENTVHQAFWFV